MEIYFNFTKKIVKLSNGKMITSPEQLKESSNFGSLECEFSSFFTD
jgi:hypothetical protein